MKTRFSRLLIILGILLLVTIACNFNITRHMPPHPRPEPLGDCGFTGDVSAVRQISRPV